MVEREIQIMDEKENWVTTASGFKTRNACADVTAQTIETWFKHASGGFDKVSGMENLKKLLEEAANDDWADLSEMLGISSVRSYLLYGPPGTGKTYLINAFAAELMKKGFRFMWLTAQDIHSHIMGVAEKTVQAAFREAADNAPCLLFIDEIENICADRCDPRVWDPRKRLTVAFLEAYSKLKSSGKRVIFLCATSHPGMVDETLLDHIDLVKISWPDERARKDYFRRALGILALEPGFTLEDIAAATENYSYRDMSRLMEELIAEIKIRAIERFADMDAEGDPDRNAVYSRAVEAIHNGEILLDRDLFHRVRGKNPPSDKTESLKELEAFEGKFR